MEMLVAFAGEEYQEKQQAGWHSVSQNNTSRQKPVGLRGTQRVPRNVPAKRCAAWPTELVLYLLLCGVHCRVLCGNSECKVFQTSIRADVATSFKLQFQDSFVTQQPHAPLSAM